jgi:hypothetical protein
MINPLFGIAFQFFFDGGAMHANSSRNGCHAASFVVQLFDGLALREGELSGHLF